MIDHCRVVAVGDRRVVAVGDRRVVGRRVVGHHQGEAHLRRSLRP
jgi:hypothetical protein